MEEGGGTDPEVWPRPTCRGSFLPRLHGCRPGSGSGRRVRPNDTDPLGGGDAELGKPPAALHPGPRLDPAPRLRGPLRCRHGLRLIPRLCGRRPLPAALVLTLLVLLASGAVLRLFGQVILQGRPGNLALLLAGALAAAGMLGTAASLALALARSSRRGQGWRASAWAAVAWWMVWAALTVATAVRASGQNGLVPANLDRSPTWVVLLGAIDNLV